MAYEVIGDLASRVTAPFQLTTDGLPWYAHAVEHFLGIDVDYATQTKVYAGEPTARYSPPRFVGAKRAIVKGNPDPRHISTSFVERQNLTMRMHMRRFTRLTNGFSKKAEMHAHAVALHFTYYNFCKVHQTLRVTPAMEAGVSDHVWEVSELVGLLDQMSQTRRP